MEGDTQDSLLVSIEDFTSASFDYLIVGGGTAGLVIAGRLAEDQDVTVGVLEAGKDRRNDPMVDTPFHVNTMIAHPDYSWNHVTEPQKGNKDRRHLMPRGKVLGGSSATNAMMYVRGSEADYDSWATILGDDGWNHESMMKYMQRHETLEDVPSNITDRSMYHYDTTFHGGSGPIHTSFNDRKFPIEDAMLNAANDSLKMTAAADAWSGKHLGFATGLGTTHNGKRSYSVNYLLNKSSKNLKVLCEAHVNNVNLADNRAIGVNFTFGGSQYDVATTKEVIVCGGAVKSPQILELSGIGDPEVLKQAGVSLKIENRGVGANFQDHAITTLNLDVKDGVWTTDRMILHPELAGPLMEEYMAKGTGFFSHVFSVTGFLPFKLLVSAEELKKTINSIEKIQTTSDFHQTQLKEVVKQLESETSANIQMLMFPVTFYPSKDAEPPTVPPAPFHRNEGAGISIVLCTLHPTSRGTVHIKSADPTVDPAIDPSYGREQADRAVLAAALRWADRMRKSDHLTDFLDGTRTWPPADWELEDLSVGTKAVEEAIMTCWHVSGSVAMGDALDSRLRVKGVSKLRVADASAFPLNISGNTQSTVYALAEKAADMIKEDNA